MEALTVVGSQVLSNRTSAAVVCHVAAVIALAPPGLCMQQKQWVSKSDEFWI